MSNVFAKFALGGLILWNLTTGGAFSSFREKTMTNCCEDNRQNIRAQVSIYLDENTESLLIDSRGNLIRTKDVKQKLDWNVKNLPDFISKMIILAIITGSYDFLRSFLKGLSVESEGVYKSLGSPTVSSGREFLFGKRKSS